MKPIKFIFILVFAFSLVACTGNKSEPRTITVTGDAEVKVVPDEVILTLGVETSNENLETAKKENDAIVQQVLKLVQSYGIESNHVQTDYLSVEPRYHDNYEKRNFIGFFVRKTIVMTLKDITKFEDLLTNVLKNEVNYVQGIEFKTTELRKHKDEARSLAIKAAQEKAVALANELGQKVGKPLMIREEQSGWYSWYGGWWGSYSGGMAQNVSQNAVQNAVGTSPNSDSTIAPGQISVNARVTVEFELSD